MITFSLETVSAAQWLLWIIFIIVSFLTDIVVFYVAYKLGQGAELIPCKKESRNGK